MTLFQTKETTTTIGEIKNPLAEKECLQIKSPKILHMKDPEIYLFQGVV